MKAQQYSFLITAKNPEKGYAGEDTQFSKRYYADGTDENEAKQNAINNFKSENPSAKLITVES